MVTYFEASRAPVDELDCFLGFDRRDSSLRVLRRDIATIQQAARHVFALAGIALDHLITRLEARVGHLGDRVLLVACLVCGQKRRVRGKREMDAREAADMHAHICRTRG